MDEVKVDDLSVCCEMLYVNLECAIVQTSREMRETRIGAYDLRPYQAKQHEILPKKIRVQLGTV